MKELNDYYPSDSHIVEEITDKEKALDYYSSKASYCWGAGKIDDTGYYQLAKPSLQSTKKKRLVIVCKNNLLGLDNN